MQQKMNSPNIINSRNYHAAENEFTEYN